jgi:hypothetical protein
MDAATATGQTKPHWGTGWRWAAPGEGAPRGRAKGPLTRLFGGIGFGVGSRQSAIGNRRLEANASMPASHWLLPTAYCRLPTAEVAAGGEPADYLVLHIPCRGSFVMDVRR